MGKTRAADSNASADNKSGPSHRSNYLIAWAVSLVTFLVYLPSLRNDFVIWDDNTYISENPHIRSLDLPFLKWAFFDFYAANWHPLTWISHALDYAFWGLDPLGHHLTNNSLHAVNTFIVVLLVVRLMETVYSRQYVVGSRQPEEVGKHSMQSPAYSLLPTTYSRIAAATTGLLFGLHPLHVESVAWLAERKDLLCALFYLLSIKSYLQYAGPSDSETVRKGPGLRCPDKHYFFAAGFFVLALLSKPMAVTLPAVLLVLDWYPLSRIRSFKSFWKVLPEKVPFIALSLASTVATISAQQAGGALSMVAMVVTPLSERAVLAAKALFSYLWNMLLPLDLIPLYPYPAHIDPLSLEYLVPVALAVGTTIICIVFARKQKLWLAAWSYYIITLLPVLGIVQVGIQSMADRYTYLPSLGPFFIAGLLVSGISKRVNAAKKGRHIIRVVSAAAGVFILVSMTYLTFKQIGIWRSRLDLWSHVIEIEPQKVPSAYGNRGDAFFEMGDLNRALEDYNRAIALDPFYTGIYYERGLLFAEMRQFDRAIADFDKAIVLDRSGATSTVGRESYYLNRGIAYLETAQSGPAVSDLKQACDLGSSRACEILQANFQTQH